MTCKTWDEKTAEIVAWYVRRGAGIRQSRDLLDLARDVRKVFRVKLAFKFRAWPTAQIVKLA